MSATLETTDPATGSTPAPVPRTSAARRTLLTLLACAVGILPLKTILSDYRWLGEAWLTMAVVILPAVVLRRRRGPSALDIWPGVLLLIPWLTWLYARHHAWGGFIPTGATMDHLGNLMDNLHRTTTDEIAPIHSTIAVRLVICALLGLLAALIDLVAVVGRRGALAGVPLLVVFTVSGAVPRTPVGWVWFSFAAAGFLVLLSLDASDELREWGRRVPRPGAALGRQGLAFSGQRIGIAAIVLAVLIPFLVPDHPRNFIADAFHNNDNGLNGIGANGNGGSISPFAALKGQLVRDKPLPMMKVHIDSAVPVQPFYARVNVLDKFTGSGWVSSDHGDTQSITASAFDTLPITGEPRTISYQAEITITGLRGNAPVFSIPRAVQGLVSDTGWSGQDQLLLHTTVHAGDNIIEAVAQPDPSLADLEAAGPATGPEMSRYLELPEIPDYVSDLVSRVTTGAESPFARSRAIFDWFADPANGFAYSLKTKEGDSGNDLVDFLQNRIGFCQQYAAAMAVMLRAAGVPARIVLGYMHPAPDKNGDFSVTTFDAHSWVEAFFPGNGWIPFDPTPPAGLTGGRKTDLKWAPHVFFNEGQQGPSRSVTVSPGQRNTTSAAPSQGAPAARGSSGSSGGSSLWLLVTLAMLVLIGLAPAVLRAARRRRRLAAARQGDPDPLWAELSDTAVDLGYVWSPARSPRQVSQWLARDAADTAGALDALAVAVEQRRYSPNPQPTDTGELARGLHDVRDQLWSRRSGRARLRALLWPASLGLGARLGALRNRVRRRH